VTYVFHLLYNEKVFTLQAAEKVALLTRPTPARQNALFPKQRSRIVQILNVPKKALGSRNRWRSFSVRQDPL
jgi:hypothetical protein